MVKIIIGNIYSKIVGYLPEIVHQDLDTFLSYKVQNARFMPSVKRKEWDGWVRLYKKNGQSFYTGLLSFVRETLTKHQIEFQKEDRRIKPEQNRPDLKFNPPPNYEERDYQDYTITKAMQYTRGILGVSTGGGKTVIISRLIGEIKTVPFMFYVLTKDLMDQAYQYMRTTLNCPIGRIGDGIVDIQPINVCTIQTAVLALNWGNPKIDIKQYMFDDEDQWKEKQIANIEDIKAVRELIRNAKGIYVDEAHHVSAKTSQAVLIASENAYWRFGGSATPYREDNADLLIQAMFGVKIVDISASYLIKRKMLVKPYVFLEPIDSDANYHSWKKIYENSIVKNKQLNDHVAETVKHLTSKGLSVLVLVQQYAQGDYLKSIIPDSEFMTSRLNSDQRLEVLEKLRSKQMMCAIASTLADEGVDLPSLDCVIMAGGGKSSTRIFQRIGRTLRKNKTNTKTQSIVVIYEHNARYLDNHAKRIRRLLKREKEFVIIPSRGPKFILDEINKVLGEKETTQQFFEL